MDIAAYLLNQRIVVDDPYNQENLREKKKIALGENAVVFDNYYRARGERIFCHVCGGHRHYKGITGVLEDGSRILFGRKCATDYFGPEVVKLHAAELRRRTSDAHARFKILSIKASLAQISEWLNSYRALVQHCSQSWIEIRAKYPEAYNEIIDHLNKNGGRFVQREHVEIKSAEQGIKRIFQDTILGSIRSPNSIPYLTQMSQQLSLVDAFVGTIDGLHFEPSSQSINNLNRMFVRMVAAAALVDACLAFTHDFFSPQKLAIMSGWTEKRRREKLAGVEETSARNLGKLFTKIMGSAFPLPPRALRDTILEIEPLKMLAQESGTLIKVVDAVVD
jgi:hypothetical protein